MPMVYATPMMILEMELASADAVTPLLEPGWITVGTEVDIRHLAATPVGATVRTTAKVIAVERRVIRFEVEAFDERARIGEGRHARGLVNVESFTRRLGPSSVLVKERQRPSRSLRTRPHRFETALTCALLTMRIATSPIPLSAASRPRSRGSSAAAGRPAPSARPARRRWCRRAR